MDGITRYNMRVDYYWDDYDDNKHYCVQEYVSDYGDWIRLEDVSDLKDTVEKLNKRLAELELENLILRGLDRD